MTRVGFSLLTASVWLTACASQPALPASAQGIISAWSGPHGGGPVFALRTLLTTEVWDTFWKQVDLEKPHPLDSAVHMGVAISLGERRSGGYSVTIISARPESGQLVIEYQENSPTPGMIVTQALTTPWAVALVPRSALPVVAHKIAAAAQPRQP